MRLFKVAARVFIPNQLPPLAKNVPTCHPVMYSARRWLIRKCFVNYAAIDLLGSDEEEKLILSGGGLALSVCSCFYYFKTANGPPLKGEKYPTTG